MGFDGKFSVHDLSETYMTPLRLMLSANISSAMCSYNAINGTPSCANGWMSGTVLRGSWGFDGVIESDCGALSHIYDQHHYATDRVHAAAAAMNGTCDVECDSIYAGYLLRAAQSGLLLPGQLSSAVRRILQHRFSLGLFDDPRNTTYFSDPRFNTRDSIHSPAHAAVARESAQQGVVLVQNPSVPRPNGGSRRPLLPLDPSVKYTLIGPIVNITDPFIGDYRPAACPAGGKGGESGTSCIATLSELFSARVGRTVPAEPGCPGTYRSRFH